MVLMTLVPLLGGNLDLVTLVPTRNQPGSGDCGVLVDSHLPGDSGAHKGLTWIWWLWLPYRVSPGPGSCGLLLASPGTKRL